MPRPKRVKKAIAELSRMLYKDLLKTGETPQNAIIKVIKAVSPLMSQ